jgi:hypothetical protein
MERCTVSLAIVQRERITFADLYSDAVSAKNNEAAGMNLPDEKISTGGVHGPCGF